MDKKTLTLVSIGTSQIDDLFIYKHKIEDGISKETNKPLKRMTLQEFIDYIEVKDNSFFYKPTNETVAFSLLYIEKELVCFHTDVSKDAMDAFISELSKISYDTSKLKFGTPVDMYDKITESSFFIIKGRMALV